MSKTVTKAVRQAKRKAVNLPAVSVPLAAPAMEKVASQVGAPGRHVVAIAPPGSPLLKGDLKLIGGSMDDDFNQRLMNQAMDAVWIGSADEETKVERRRAAARAMIGIAPKDELEGMLAAQMVATQAAAMECHRRAMLSEQTLDNYDCNLRHAAKLTRVYAELMLALDKHRGKGQQKVVVEHVHVYPGGQAIVGTVEAGGGVRKIEKGQPHALGYAPGETLPGEVEAIKEALPIPRG